MAGAEDWPAGSDCDSGGSASNRPVIEPLRVFARQRRENSLGRRIVQAGSAALLCVACLVFLVFAASQRHGQQRSTPFELTLSALEDSGRQAEMRSRFEAYSRRPSSEKVAKQALHQISILKHESEDAAREKLERWGFRPPSQMHHATPSSRAPAGLSLPPLPPLGNSGSGPSLQGSLQDVVSTLEDSLHGHGNGEELREDSGELMQARRLIDQALEEASEAGHQSRLAEQRPQSRMEEGDGGRQEQGEGKRRNHEGEAAQLPHAADYRYWNGGGDASHLKDAPRVRMGSDYVSSVWGDRSHHEHAVPYQAVRGEKLRGEAPLPNVEKRPWLAAEATTEAYPQANGFPY